MEDPSRPVTGYPAVGYPPPQNRPSANGCPPPQSNTAYPYPAPPPSYPPYSHNYHAPPYSNPRSTFVRRLLIAMIAVFVIFGTVIFICWLVLRPRLPQFRVDSVSVSNFSVSPSQQVTGNWEVRFQVYNPNKRLRISYDDVESFILCKSELLSQSRIPPFYQETKNQTAVIASFSASNTYVDAWRASAINSDKARGSVSFDVRLLASVGLRSGGWRWRRRLLRVWCGDLAVGISGNSGSGKLVGGSRSCYVRL